MANDQDVQSALTQFSHSVGLCDDQVLFHIDRRGQWFYQSSPLPNKFACLFATILVNRADDVGYCLQTPVERCLVDVEQYPFLIVDYDVDEQGVFTVTSSVKRQWQVPSVSEFIVTDSEIKLILPNDLPAKLARSCYYRFIEQFLLVGQ
ncbi:DUF1285 domain-containing protein [Shewanella waksmanii]|uniref:DUF1285 domain-containing protein n=1 Tax=Shewanella waksmanii TaxID=213783 RepID=UPI00373688E5